ncbi:uncharacterized protein LY89DRAFT_652373 [Mollisia scopiformis]|uniref:Heterokaryon incompatibility domain-containing protein n=1 Tax=Mollisia scopiformis TaxID=149040 RepID=A0A194WYG6_MOLSC|nr:uncharacterized protein LY89DRAFT_652373 [Mollisia scopiformis]KUJ12985.1 hypothetical protein LY89DRAFT_652373 [Mollisia scopiformis]
MDEEFDHDKKINRATDFKYPTIQAKRQVRLLRARFDEEHKNVVYSLEVVPLSELPWECYKALSYTWGHAHTADDVRAIQIDNQPFSVRRNLFQFLEAAADREEYGLFFIDAICINQLDHEERQSQVQEMARIYRNSNEVIGWLGIPEINQIDNIRPLSGTKRNAHEGCPTWSSSQWEGFRYLSQHNFWSRLWIVQEVLLAESMTIWCGSFTFPLSLFGSATKTSPILDVRIAPNGRPHKVISPTARLQSPATTIVTHRLRSVPRPLRGQDPLAQGTIIGTLEEMTTGLKNPTERMTTYQSKIADLYHEVISKFGRLECSDPRDKLYGFLGILNEKSRAKVDVDYRKDVSYAFYQALKIGIQEIFLEHGGVVYPDDRNCKSSDYLAFYCDVRDAFGIDDKETLVILGKVLEELNFRKWVQEAEFEVQNQQQFVWRDQIVDVHPGFKWLSMFAEIEKEGEDGGNGLYRYHQRQGKMIERLMAWFRDRSRRKDHFRRLEKSRQQPLIVREKS